MTLIDIVVLIVLLVSLAIVSIMKKRMKSLAEWQKDNSSKIKDIHGRVWDWDGESLTCNDPGAVGFGPFKKLVESFVKVKPDPGTSIKIESEEQVSQKTLFLS